MLREASTESRTPDPQSILFRPLFLSASNFDYERPMVTGQQTRTFSEAIIIIIIIIIIFTSRVLDSAVMIASSSLSNRFPFTTITALSRHVSNVLAVDHVKATQTLHTLSHHTDPDFPCTLKHEWAHTSKTLSLYHQTFCTLTHNEDQKRGIDIFFVYKLQAGPV